MDNFCIDTLGIGLHFMGIKWESRQTLWWWEWVVWL